MAEKVDGMYESPAELKSPPDIQGGLVDEMGYKEPSADDMDGY